MSNRPIFKLNNRLLACADKVRESVKLVDVGTDHAYLPIWLVKNNLIFNAIAVDIKESPLKIAEKHIKKYHVEDKIELRLSDGLSKVRPDEADDIIIAGMGGENIERIIKKTIWLKDPEKHLIIQSMKSTDNLKNFLHKESFYIESEDVVESDNRIYTVMLVYFKERID